MTSALRIPQVSSGHANPPASVSALSKAEDLRVSSENLRIAKASGNSVLIEQWARLNAADRSALISARAHSWTDQLLPETGTDWRIYVDKNDLPLGLSELDGRGEPTIELFPGECVERLGKADEAEARAYLQEVYARSLPERSYA